MSSSTGQWNLGAWLGTVLGGTLFMFGVTIEIQVKTGSGLYVLLTLGVGTAILATGALLWQLRSRLALFSAALVFSGALYPATLAVFAFRQLAGIETYRLEDSALPITALFVLLTLEFAYLGRRGGDQA